MSLGSSLVRRAVVTRIYGRLHGWGARIHAETPIAFFAIVLAVAFTFRLGMGLLRAPSEDPDTAISSEIESTTPAPTTHEARPTTVPASRPASAAGPSIRREAEELPPDTITPRGGIPKRKAKKRR